MGECVVSLRLFLPHATVYVGERMALLSDQTEGLQTELGGGNFQLRVQRLIIMVGLIGR